MVRKIILIGFMCLLSMNLFGNEKAGYVLLDMISDTFRDMAQKGTGGYEVVDRALQEMMSEAKKAKAQEKIDPVFYRRYTRIIRMIKLFMMPDPEGILAPLIKREIKEFVEEVTGESSNVDRKKSIGLVAGTIAEEILNLHLYLETRKDRDELMKKYEKKYGIEKKKRGNNSE